MQDAYTTSEWFPYAQPQSSGGLNYIRNSVKVVIDAYNGSGGFYVSDPDDPLIKTYQRIFPGLFKPLLARPADLQQPIPYPEDVFLVQPQRFRPHHMDRAQGLSNPEGPLQTPRPPPHSD